MTEPEIRQRDVPTELHVQAIGLEAPEVEVRRLDHLQQAVRIAAQQPAELIGHRIARIGAVQVVALAQRSQARNHGDHLADADFVVVDGC